AVTKPRHQLAVVDDETAEGRLRRLRRAAEFPDLAEDFLRGPNRRLHLKLLGAKLARHLLVRPHGCSPRVSVPGAIQEQAVGSVNHKPSGQDLWAYAHAWARALAVRCRGLPHCTLVKLTDR